MIQIRIDGRSYEVEEGENLLHTGLSLGLDIPYFCWHPAMGSVGACRLCAVKQFKDENDSKGKIVMSCMTPVEDGMIVSIRDPEVVEFRRTVTEWLMVNHPHDCPVCDEGGECHLQDMTVMTGHCYREYRFRKRTHRNQYLGPFVNHEMNRCIQCYRCTRFYRDLAGGTDLQVFGAHDHVYFGRRSDGILEREFSGNLVEICPTGVFTDKTLKQHYTRKWDLQTAPSVCVHCGVGCNTIPGERYGSLRRIRNRFNSEVNGYFLCDRGRFGYEFVNAPTRIRRPRLKPGNRLEGADPEAARERLDGVIAGGRKILGIGSPRASLEANFALRKLAGEENFSPGLSGPALQITREIVDILERGPARPFSIGDLEKADAVLVLGEDLTNTAPRMDLALHSSVRRRPLKEIAAARNIHAWHDAAVREAIQQAKGPLFVATPTKVKLDAIAQVSFRGTPDEIARLGFAVAAALGAEIGEIPAEPEIEELAAEIAREMKDADSPAVVSGLSLGSRQVLHAAANVASALDRPERRAGICLVVPECNSIGAAMLGGRPCESVLEECGGDGSILVILENDLFQRCAGSRITERLGETGQVIFIGHTESETSALADIVLPSGTFAESTGTFINFEGRAQRFYRVFDPDPGIPESWRQIQELIRAREPGHSPWETLEQVQTALETELPRFRGIRQAAERPGFRIHGQRIPRQPHRYSGRTAIDADRQIHEPRPGTDPDSPLSFSMEGYRGQPPPDLLGEYWAGGWNSVQALNKFQEEVGGPLRDGPTGIRLIEPEAGRSFEPYRDIPGPAEAANGEWLAIPIHHIFGSDRLSGLAPSIAEMAPGRYIKMNQEDASKLGVSEGEPLAVRLDGEVLKIPARIDDSLKPGLVGLPSIPGLRLRRPRRVELRRLEDEP